MIIGNQSWHSRKLVMFKVNGKWRRAQRFIGRLLVDYQINTKTMQLEGSFGNIRFRSLSYNLPWKVEDYIYSETL